MTKEELFEELANKINTGEISNTEITSRFGSLGMNANIAASNPEPKHFSVNKMLYILGAAVTVIGILIFVQQIWYSLGMVAHIAMTLGLGFLFTLLGSFLLKQNPDKNIGSVFHAIGGMLIPGGAMVTLGELHLINSSIELMSYLAVIFGVMFVFYLLLNYVHRTALLTFFAIANATAFLYFTVSAFLDNMAYMEDDVYAYLAMVIGASYLFLAHAFRDGWNKSLVGVLTLLGSFAILAAGFSQVFDSIPWQMFYFLLVIGGIFLSASMKSRSMLLFSTLFLIAHVSYITGKYFADSVGWPLSLIVLGFIFIGLGYISININKKYITN